MSKWFFIDFSYRLGHQAVFCVEPKSVTLCKLNDTEAYKMTLSNGEEIITDKDYTFETVDEAKHKLEEILENITMFLYMGFAPISLDLEPNNIKIGENNE